MKHHSKRPIPLCVNFALIFYAVHIEYKLWTFYILLIYIQIKQMIDDASIINILYWENQKLAVQFQWMQKQMLERKQASPLSLSSHPFHHLGKT
jgi:hypothetical protein